MVQPAGHFCLWHLRRCHGNTSILPNHSAQPCLLSLLNLQRLPYLDCKWFLYNTFYIYSKCSINWGNFDKFQNHSTSNTYWTHYLKKNAQLSLWINWLSEIFYLTVAAQLLRKHHGVAAPCEVSPYSEQYSQSLPLYKSETLKEKNHSLLFPFVFPKVTFQNLSFINSHLNLNPPPPPTPPKKMHGHLWNADVYYPNLLVHCVTCLLTVACFHLYFCLFIRAVLIFAQWSCVSEVWMCSLRCIHTHRACLNSFKLSLWYFSRLFSLFWMRREMPLKPGCIIN